LTNKKSTALPHLLLLQNDAHLAAAAQYFSGKSELLVIDSAECCNFSKMKI